MFLLRFIDKIDIKIYKNTRIHLKDWIFWSSFCLLLVIHCLENTALTYSDISWFAVVYIFRNFLYLLLIAEIIILYAFKPKEIWGGVILLLIGVLSFLCSNDFGLCELFILIIAAKDKNPKTMLSLFTYIKGSGVLLTLFLYAVGIMPTLYYNDDIVGAYNTLGFCHRNVLGDNMVSICIAWFYIRYGKLNKRDIFGWSILSALTYKLAMSRSACIIMFLTIVLVYICQKYSSRIMKIKNIERILVGIILGLLMTSILGTVMFDDSSMFWTFIDRIYTKRFRFSHQCLVDHGLSLFGKNLPFISSMDAQNLDKRKLILDNSYMRVLLYYGIIPGIIYLIGYIKTFRKNISLKKYALSACMLIFAIYGFSERYMLDVNYNIFIVFASQPFFSQMKKKDEKRCTIIKMIWHYTRRIV